MPKLILMEHPGKTRQVSLGPHETKIGRASTNDIVIDVNQVSRVHASIMVGPAFVTLRDLGSRNGTFVNGVKVETLVLANGDSIKIGECEMRFLANDQEYSQVDALRLLTVPGLLIDIDGAANPLHGQKR
ncbi:FHA domain-containing protein [Variovorax sp. YR216]|uniref:FHA domain-containing protein n=1 Tax=Variovorax sp. YR216 TaxID=1882828 RepID=UPI00089A4274|nr:FHA domain-containing protein [Variovorax sp. YR216]SEB10011.1 FHA domain-containing protein [Variovorax sp. YR216]